ncbi:sugar ABC transporter ATP-binding protein [Synergistaceae bacterium OttesenSCG-928-I11]|nr:sugar ABC transporter ATP-binding protein [Synergistaceae bacterium OttesenSCG-928-I11]
MILSETLLCFKNVSKSYYGNTVLSDICFEVSAGEIHALIGENGAGKSTLMNILFGMSVIHSTGGYEGDVIIDGKKTFIKTPFEALDAGVGMVHQEFMLIPGFTITENIKLNREITTPNIASRVLGKRLETLDMVKMDADARKALDTLSMDIEEFTLVEGLPVGHKQFIEIAREIDKTGIKILVFDEPTAVLTESEAQNLLAAMRRLAQTGIGILFISHRLDEIIDVADRVTVLRDGQLVKTMNTKDTDVVEIAQLMIGREVTITPVQTDAKKISDEVMLSVKDLHVGMPGEMVRGIDLEVRRGEIVGIGGLAGQGKLGIANGIMGTYPSTGEVVFNGNPLALNDPRATLASGIAFVSEDRKGVGLLLNESIELNIAFTAMQVNGHFLSSLAGWNLRNDREIRENAERMIKDLDIRCSSSLQSTGSLSGGNQQKVCVARALTQKPQFLFVSEPTRGIDIGAKKLILDLLLRLSEEYGMTIVMTSSELAELRSICNRIVIICDGRVEGILPPDASDAEFGLMMSGSRGLTKNADLEPVH